MMSFLRLQEAPGTEAVAPPTPAAAVDRLMLHPDPAGSPPAAQPLGRAPYISMHAFCETAVFATAVEQAAADRRLSRAEVTVATGGMQGAARFFTDHPTPDLLVIETRLQGEALFSQLDELAKVCDAKTKVVLVGAVNDIVFYRQLVERGIDDYLVAPVQVLGVVEAVLKLFPQDEATRLGKIVAFIGAKGGTGSSTIAQNTAFSLARGGSKVLLADLDLQFGTAALNYDIDAAVGFTEQLAGSDRLDDALFERLLHKQGPNLSILAGATASRDVLAPPLEVLDRIIDRARATFPLVLLDLPHEWTPWVRQALLSSDEVVVTAEPDLANLRNVRTMFDLLKTVRPHDADPRLVLNRIGVARREELKPAEFGARLAVPVDARIGFAPRAFARAASAGQMVAAMSPSHGRPFAELAQALGGRSPVRTRRFLLWRRAGRE